MSQERELNQSRANLHRDRLEEARGRDGTTIHDWSHTMARAFGKVLVVPSHGLGRIQGTKVLHPK